MLSPLKPLLCRHEFYWSERHRADLCRRCGKTRVASEPEFASWPGPHDSGNEDPAVLTNDHEGTGPVDSAYFEIPAPEGTPPPEPRVSLRRTPSSKVLKAQAQERRDNLLALLDRIAEGGQPSRRDTLDALLAVIEDAHSADPVLFGADTAGRFARLHEARSGLIF